MQTDSADGHLWEEEENADDEATGSWHQYDWPNPRSQRPPERQTKPFNEYRCPFAADRQVTHTIAHPLNEWTPHQFKFSWLLATTRRRRLLLSVRSDLETFCCADNNIINSVWYLFRKATQGVQSEKHSEQVNIKYNYRGKGSMGKAVEVKAEECKWIILCIIARVIVLYKINFSYKMKPGNSEGGEVVWWN